MWVFTDMRGFMADSDELGANYGKFSYYDQQGVLKFGFPITTRLWGGFWT